MAIQKKIKFLLILKILKLRRGTQEEGVSLGCRSSQHKYKRKKVNLESIKQVYDHVVQVQETRGNLCKLLLYDPIDMISMLS